MTLGYVTIPITEAPGPPAGTITHGGVCHHCRFPTEIDDVWMSHSTDLDRVTCIRCHDRIVGAGLLAVSKTVRQQTEAAAGG